MAFTILETLKNANDNLQEAIIPFPLSIGQEQLRTALILLEKGYDLYEDVEALIEKHEGVELMPEK